MVHIYHGDGKGKTTAAMGLAVRAAGAQKQVVIVQFLKGTSTSEMELLAQIPNITILRENNSSKFSFAMNEQERQKALQTHRNNLSKAINLAYNNKCDVLILDEALDALNLHLLDVDIVKELLQTKSNQLEIVFTGRNPSAFLIESADYITQMKCERHPYQKGTSARKGIEY